MGDTIKFYFDKEVQGELDLPPLSTEKSRHEIASSNLIIYNWYQIVSDGVRFDTRDMYNNYKVWGNEYLTVFKGLPRKLKKRLKFSDRHRVLDMMRYRMRRRMVPGIVAAMAGPKEGEKTPLSYLVGGHTKKYDKKYDKKYEWDVNHPYGKITDHKPEIKGGYNSYIRPSQTQTPDHIAGYANYTKNEDDGK